ncbi:hypothetical protein [uncultured Ruminococcus sp.]|uniref:hypothetical protein n=1 Tax=uncultured Ruminococcus sp. TaxID=165186 RepID=UPI0015B56DD6|nr:hypothetical protein [uncultured Ruminococcus sp.]
MGTVPKSTKADIKFFFGLSAQRIVIAIIVGFGSFSICQEAISSIPLQIIMSLAMVALSLVLSGKSPSNPKITFAKGLIFFVMNLIEPKKYYGTEAEEYRLHKEREAEKNEKKKKQDY